MGVDNCRMGDVGREMRDVRRQKLKAISKCQKWIRFYLVLC